MDTNERTEIDPAAEMAAAAIAGMTVADWRTAQARKAARDAAAAEDLARWHRMMAPTFVETTDDPEEEDDQ